MRLVIEVQVSDKADEFGGGTLSRFVRRFGATSLEGKYELTPAEAKHIVAQIDMALHTINAWRKIDGTPAEEVVDALYTPVSVAKPPAAPTP